MGINKTIRERRRWMIYVSNDLLTELEALDTLGKPPTTQMMIEACRALREKLEKPQKRAKG